MAHAAKAARAYGRGCLRSIIAVPLGILLSVTMLGTLLWLIKDVSGPEDPRVDLAFVVAGAFPAAVLLGVAGLAIGVANWRGRKLDAAFERWDLRGRQSGPVMRGWHGEIDGRRFDAWFQKGPQLQLYLDCEPATRGAILEGSRPVSWLNKRFAGREPLGGMPPELEGLAVYADDERWMRRWLESGATREAVAALLADDPRASAILTIAPDAVVYSRRYFKFSEVQAAAVEGWVQHLSELARQADRIGSATEGAEPTRLELWARKSRGKYLNLVLFGCLGMGLLVLALMTLWMVIVH